jgi:trehalose 6-phosphate synthase
MPGAAARDPITPRVRGRGARSAGCEFVILANRLPSRRVTRDGERVWAPSPGGLVSALRPVLEREDGAWIGWSGQAADAPAPFDLAGIHNVPVELSREEVRRFYEGFSNRTIWPLYHDAVRTPEFRRIWWRAYERVNRRFAEAASEIAADGATVWAHDYHLQLAPAMLRALRPDLRIGFFLHIPFPPPELFARLPWRRQVLEGLLGADVVGFQTRSGADNFCRLVERFTGARAHGDGVRTADGRDVVARAFPISIDVAERERLASDEKCRRRAATLRKKLGPARRIILGVDRLDYTKGIDLRLKAFRELLQSGRLSVQHCVLVQIAVPSREKVQEYIDLRREIEETVGSINGEFGEVGRIAVQYMHRSLSAERLAAYYAAADVMLVTPLRDGMNLVAKEYVASRVDDTGTLVLSEFTGAAHELADALLVNPHDVDGLEAVIERALTMPEAEAKRRMQSMRRVVREHDVHAWAASFLEALGNGRGARDR